MSSLTGGGAAGAEHVLPADTAEVPDATATTRGGTRAMLRAYLALTKPNIIWLLLITTVPAMVMAERGWPSTWLVIATLIGGALAAGGANSMNQYADRDIDARMERTRNRPLPGHRVDPRSALTFGLGLGVVAFLWMGAFVNWPAAWLAVAAIAFYVVIYTYLLKRSTVQNIVIGGAAGAAPPMIGWAAVTGSVGLEAVLLFLVVFYWTPPHFWALALLLEDDYRRARVPMLPVVRGVAETKRQIVLYTLVLLPLTVVLAGVADLSWIYLTVATVSGGWFLWQAERLRREPGIGRALPVFKFSTYYLAAIFFAMMADVLILA